MNQAHTDMDDTADYAVGHPEIRRRGAHRAQPLAADWPARRPFVPQGCDQQGRLAPTIKPAEKREFSGLGQDRMPEEWDEDQSESADVEVAAVVAVILLVTAAFWTLVKIGVGA